ncbi:MAG TPA: alpha/beta hydrolase [Solirubrobacterales bacterium]|nr:alpha/beta hydrolase [Solirubrobacterales bacterium]
MAAAPGQAIEIDGRRYAWRAVGSGPRLVLVNGYGGTGADWDPTFLGALAERFEVICPDNRGMGDSELGDEELTVAAMAADVEELMDALEIEAAAVCGWSMGGYVCQALAESSPYRVSALALIGTHPGGPAYVPTGDAEAFANLIDYSGTPREQASRLISVLFPPAQAAAIDAELGELVAAARAQLDHRALDAQEAALFAWRDREPPPPPSEPPPAVVLHGRLDRLVAAGNAAPLGERWGARVEIFEASAHAAMAQEPERAATAIAAVALGT